MLSNQQLSGKVTHCCIDFFLTFAITRAHKDILLFASPFFEAALSGKFVVVLSFVNRALIGSPSWSETGRPLSMSSVITISQPPVVPGDKPNLEPLEGITFAPAPDSDEDADDFADPFEDAHANHVSMSLFASCSSQTESLNTPKVEARCDQSENDPGATVDNGDEDQARQKARVGSLEKLQGGWSSKKGKGKEVATQNAATEKEKKEREDEREEDKDKMALHPVKIRPRRTNSRVPEAIIVLKEEKVSVISRSYDLH